MDALQIAKLKDEILNYLSLPENRDEHYTASEISILLDLKDVPLILLQGYVQGIGEAGLVNYFESDPEEDVFIINDLGRRFVINDGFVTQLKKELAILEQQEEDRQNARIKTKLEISNLRLTKRISIIAIIISILSLGLTILFKILS